MKLPPPRAYRNFAIGVILINSIMMALSNNKLTFICGIIGITLAVVGIFVSHIASIHDE